MLDKSVGQYRISKKIGAGGMGVVYLAEHTLLGRQAAVKLLLPELTQDRVVVSRFFNEARAATSIRHPGIVEIYDFGFEADGSAYIVMEYLQGETLTQRAKRGLISYDGALAIVRQIASALAAAHNKGIIHRDLKPDNIFLVPDPDVFGGERIKLLDFGIAKLTADPPRSEEITRNGEEDGEGGEGRQLTRTGAVMGTPAYMAPEQCRGIVVDHRADLYSLGCILFRLCTGRPPFIGAGIGDVLAAHIHVPPPSIASMRPDVPHELERLVQRLLVKDPAQRLGSAEEVIAAIEQANSSPAYRTSAQLPGIFAPASGGPSSSEPTSHVSGLTAALASRPSNPSHSPHLSPSSPHAAAAASPAGTIPAIPSKMGLSQPELPTMSTLSDGAGAEAVVPAVTPVRSRRGWMAALAAAAVAAIAAVTILSTRGPSSSDDRQAAALAEPDEPPPRAPLPSDKTISASAPLAASEPAQPAPQPTQPTQPPEAAATVDVAIDSKPAGATLTLDGTVLGRTPYRGAIPRADRTASLVVRLAGHKDHKLDVSVAAPITQTVTLEKKRNGRPTGRGRNDSVNPF